MDSKLNSLFREIAIFDTDDSLVQTFTNSVFLYPCAVEFNADTREAYVLGKYIALKNWHSWCFAMTNHFHIAMLHTELRWRFLKLSRYCSVEL